MLLWFTHQGRSNVDEQSALIRQWILLKILSVRTCGTTIGELAKEVEVSGKTIRRDLSTYRTAGFSIEESLGKFGRNSYRLDSGWSKPESYSISTRPSRVRGWRADTLKLLKTSTLCICRLAGSVMAIGTYCHDVFSSSYLGQYQP